MTIIKTQLITFTANSNEEYRAFKAQHLAKGVKPLEGWSPQNVPPKQKHVTGEVWLETDNLFENQWNTTSDSPTNPNMRVFDWSGQMNPHNRKNEIPVGHYLVITDEMRAIRAKVRKCGYCGHYEREQNDLEFCPACLGSEYLSRKDLHLTRLKPVNFTGKRAPLTEQEQATLFPAYTAAQLTADAARQEKYFKTKLQELCKEHDDAIKKADTKLKGFTWLIDNRIRLENVIYYDHKGEFCFGWRNKLDQETAKQLEKLLENFPFNYTIEQN